MVSCVMPYPGMPPSLRATAPFPLDGPLVRNWQPLQMSRCALAAMPPGRSTRTPETAHNVLVPAIQQVERDTKRYSAGGHAEGAAGRMAFEVADPGAGGSADDRGNCGMPLYRCSRLTGVPVEAI